MIKWPKRCGSVAWMCLVLGVSAQVAGAQITGPQITGPQNAAKQAANSHDAGVQVYGAQVDGAQVDGRDEPSEMADDAQFGATYLYLDNSFGAFWANSPNLRIDTASGAGDGTGLATGTGLAGRRALGLVTDTQNAALSLALFYASGEDEFAKNRYRIDGLGLEFGYERGLVAGFGLTTGLGVGAYRTKLKVDGSAFQDDWTPGLSVSAGGSYELSDWRSIALKLRSDILPASNHDWPQAGAVTQKAVVSSRIHTQLELTLRRRF